MLAGERAPEVRSLLNSPPSLRRTRACGTGSTPLEVPSPFWNPALPEPLREHLQPAVAISERPLSKWQTEGGLQLGRARGCSLRTLHNFRSGCKMAAPGGGFQPRERRAAEQEEDWEAVTPKRPRLGAGSKIGGRRLIVVLEGASLETVKVVAD